MERISAVTNDALENFSLSRYIISDIAPLIRAYLSVRFGHAPVADITVFVCLTAQRGRAYCFSGEMDRLNRTDHHVDDDSRSLATADCSRHDKRLSLTASPRQPSHVRRHH